LLLTSQYRTETRDFKEKANKDRFGVIWVGTRNGLDRFDRATEVFTHFKEDTKNPAGLISNNINALYKHRSGVLWIGSLEGLSRYDAYSDVIRPEIPKESDH
jgi:ligand-binding sensor domain-containing protein